MLEVGFYYPISNIQIHLPVLYALCLDNGGDSGVTYSAVPFCSQLIGPFAVVSSIAFTPRPATL